MRTDESRETVVLEDGSKLVSVHSRYACAERHCSIHNPGPHNMREWSLHWRADRGIMERICPHGTGHPDPDDAAFRALYRGDYDTVHGCDGCCWHVLETSCNK